MHRLGNYRKLSNVRSARAGKANRGGAKPIFFGGGGGCKTTFCRQKGVASALLGRGQNELYSFLSDVQQ